MPKYAISRFINGICLNPREYIVESGEEDAPVILFDSEQAARDHLIETGWTEEDVQESLDGCAIFIEPYEEESEAVTADN